MRIILLLGFIGSLSTSSVLSTSTTKNTFFDTCLMARSAKNPTYVKKSSAFFVNDPPIALNDTSTTAQGTADTIDVLLNDFDPEGGVLNTRYVEFLGPRNGIARVINQNEIIYTPNSDFVGLDSFQYFSCDVNSECSVAWIFITIEDVPEPPMVDESTLSMVETDEDVPLDLLIGENTTDPEGDTLVISILDDVVHGSTTILGDTIHYVPDENYNGLDSLRYTVCDPTPLCDTLWTVITVNPVNDDPITIIDQVVLTEDTLNAQIKPLTNDTDVDNDILTIGIISSIKTSATISIQDDSIVVYSPPANFFGIDTLIYEACDPITCVVDTIIITVTPINDAPDAVNDPIDTDEEVAVSISILDNDSDVENDDLTTTIISTPSNGNATFNNDTLHYVPNIDFTGVDSIQYVLCDTEPLCDTAWIIITVNNVNDPPSTDSDNIVLTEDTLNVEIWPLINDSDPDGDLLTIGSIVSISTAASVSIIDDTTVVYTPPADYFGIDTLLYEACDLDTCVVDTLFITVTPINDAPVAIDDNVTLEEDNTILIAILDNDTDVDSDILTISINTNPSSGTVSIINDSLEYIPDPNFNGLDSIQYVLCDAEPLCDTAWVLITINDVNDEPETNTDNITLPEDSLNAPIWPLVNDSDADGDDLTIGTIISTNTTATITVIDDTTVIYTPPADYSGIDTILYEVCDTDVCVVDTLIITVTPVNDPPVALDDNASLDEDDTILIAILDNDSDIDSEILTITINTNPSNGTVSIINDSLQYIPNANFNGLDSIQYVLCDAEPLCDTAWTYITINPINDPPDGFNPPGTPNADGEVIICVVEDTTNVIVWPFGGSSDVDGDELILVSTTLPTSGGTVTLQGDTAFIYNPPADWNGMDTIGIEVCDPHGLCVTDTIYIDVKPVSDELVAIDDQVSLPENDSTEIQVAINDLNPDGGGVTITIIDQPDNGTAQLNGSIIEYIPNDDFFGTDSLTYEICNTAGFCDIAKVYIIVEFVNEKPIAQNDYLSITDTSCVNLNIVTNDNDPNGDTLVIEILNGRSTDVTIENDGSITYCPPDDFMITDTIYYAVCDTHAMQLCDTAMIVIDMICPVFNHALTHDAQCPGVSFSVIGTDIKTLSRYEWSFTDQLGVITDEPTISELKINSPKRLALQSQRYGCSTQYDSIDVVVRNIVAPAELDDEMLECENTSISLSVNTPNSLLTYDWFYTSTNAPIGSGSEIIISNLDNSTEGNYYVIASDGFCFSQASDNINLQTITDFAPPIIDAGTDQTLCGQEISLNAVTTPRTPTWQTNGSAFIADNTDPLTRIFDPEIGENKFYWVQENQSCINNSIDSVSIFYYPLPALESDSFFVELNQDYTFDITPNDNYYNLNKTITVLNTPEEVIDHGDGTITVNIDGTKESPLDFEYQVCFNECPNNCQTTVVNIYFEEPITCIVPNVITPNGDGINDYLVIDCANQHSQSSMIIFNRWGDEVYNNENYDNSWGGTKDGEPLAVGTYFYLFKVNNDEQSIEKGFVHIDR